MILMNLSSFIEVIAMLPDARFLAKTRRTNVIRLISAAMALLLGPKQIINVVDERREKFSLSFSRYRKVAPTHAKSSRKERKAAAGKTVSTFPPTFHLYDTRLSIHRSEVGDKRLFHPHNNVRRRTALSRATLCVSRVCSNA